MIVKSNIKQSYTPERFTSRFVFRGYGKNDVPKFEEIKTEVFEISLNEELTIVSVSKNKDDEYIISVRNKAGKVFMLGEKDIIIPKDINLKDIMHKYKRVMVYRNDGKLIYDSDIAIAILAIQPEPFDLDSL